MRIPLAVDLESRDGTVSKDSKVLNGYIEPNGDSPPRLRRRPGSTDLGNIRSGNAQGAYYYNGFVITAHSNNADRSTTGPLANTSIGTLDGNRTFNALNFAAGLASAQNFRNASANHGLTLGEIITISGATDPLYNVTKTITDNTATGFFRNNSGALQYTVGGAPANETGNYIASVAPVYAGRYYFADNGLTSGTSGFLFVKGDRTGQRIRSDWDVSDWLVPAGTNASSSGYPAATVAGTQFLDGYFFVMDAAANIYNCDLNADPGDTSKWQASSVIRADKESGNGVYLARVSDFIVALKDFSTEVFYDAGNPAPGTPLSPVDNAFTHNGCASAGSVTLVQGNLAWMSQGRSKGRGVHVMVGTQQQKISSDDVDRILDADDLATVYAWGFVFGGHAFYVLTLVTSNITLVYDFTAQTWCQWSSLTLGVGGTVTSLTRSGTTVTVQFVAPHGMQDGDPLLIAGATPSAYNGIWAVSSLSVTAVTFQITGSPDTPATGTITGTPYAETYFKFPFYVNGGGKDLVLHESNGHIYQLSPSVYQDAGIPINTFARSVRLDGGAIGKKTMPRLWFIADKVSDTLMARWSDDDSGTFSSYRRVDLSSDKPQLRRNGKFRRRSLEVRFIGNNPLRLEAAEIELGE